jgi:hypothetical protein
MYFAMRTLDAGENFQRRELVKARTRSVDMMRDGSLLFNVEGDLGPFFLCWTS